MAPFPSHPRLRRRLAHAAWLAAGLVLTLAGCGGSSGTPQAPASDRPLAVLASIPPLAGVVAALAPEGVVAVESLVPAGQSEHGYQMTAADVSRVARAGLIVRVGLGLERGLDAAILHAAPHARVLTFAEVVGIEGEASCDLPHDHATNSGTHAGTPGFVDPHLWLDPALVARLVPEVSAALADELAEREPAEEGRYRASLAARESAFLERVEAIDRDYRDRLAPFAGQAIVTHHAAFGRVAERYGLRVVAVLRPVSTAEPTPAEVDGAVRAIRAEHARAVFTEPQYDRAFAARIAQAAGVRLATLDPLGPGDWEVMMRSNLEAIVDALAEPAGEAASGG